MSASATVAFMLFAVATASSQPPSHSLLQATTVRLEVEKFAFTSGLVLGDDGNPNGKGTDIMAWPLACGSGFLLGKDGTLATTYLVAQRATRVVAVFEDGSRYIADTLVTWDSQSDLAVLKLTSTKPFSSTKLGDSDSVKVLDEIFVAGDPLCQGLAVTHGDVNRLLKNNAGRIHLIQNSASTGPGTYGGPVYREGRVIGLQSHSDWPYEMHYAVAVNRLKALLKKTEPMDIATAFSVDPKHIASRREHIHSVNDTVAAATEESPGMGSPYWIDLSWRHMDIEIAVEANPGSDVAIFISDAARNRLGYGNQAANTESVYLSTEVPRRIAVYVLNLSPSETKFGLSVFWIRW